jgi:hypothetical protein
MFTELLLATFLSDVVIFIFNTGSLLRAYSGRNFGRSVRQIRLIHNAEGRLTAALARKLTVRFGNVFFCYFVNALGPDIRLLEVASIRFEKFFHQVETDFRLLPSSGITSFTRCFLVTLL